MAKGLFTQGMCVLLRNPLSSEEIQECLKGITFQGRLDSIGDDETEETLVYRYSPEANGSLLVMPSSSVWPDDLGDPDESPERFVAWSLGQFGPLAFPGGLQRAADQSWGWEGADEAIQHHTAHVRFLISYVMDGEHEQEDDAPLIPEDYDPLDELQFLTKVVANLLEHEDAICYFNPGGEVLREEEGLRRGLNYAWNHDLPPLDMWTNVRLFRADKQWTLMDTVGNSQFDLPDLEAAFQSEQYDPSEVEGFLRSATLYMLRDHDVVQDGDSADGPGETSWVAMECNDALSDPPRETIRWIPADGTTPPSELLERGEALDFEEDDLEGETLDDEIDDELDRESP